MSLGPSIRRLIRKLLTRSRRTKWDRTRDVHEVFAELKRSAIYSAVPYGVGTAVWKSVATKLQTLLPPEAYQGLATGIDNYAIPLCGLAIGTYIAWRGWTTYKLVRKLKLKQSISNP